LRISSNYDKISYKLALELGSGVYALGITEKLAEAIERDDFPNLREEELDDLKEWVAGTLARNSVIIEKLRQISKTDPVEIVKGSEALKARIKELRFKRDYLLQKKKIKGLVI